MPFFVHEYWKHFDSERIIAFAISNESRCDTIWLKNQICIMCNKMGRNHFVQSPIEKTKFFFQVFKRLVDAKMICTYSAVRFAKSEQSTIIHF